MVAMLKSATLVVGHVNVGVYVLCDLPEACTEDVAQHKGGSNCIQLWLEDLEGV